MKVLFTRPELATQPSIEEAAVRLSVLPVRLNIDQVGVAMTSPVTSVETEESATRCYLLELERTWLLDT